jgi:hypothetical protein
MIIKKKKRWDGDPNTWDGRFYIPEKYRRKIRNFLEKKKL